MTSTELEALVNRDIASMRAVSVETARKLVEKIKEQENEMRRLGIRGL